MIFIAADDVFMTSHLSR